MKKKPLELEGEWEDEGEGHKSHGNEIKDEGKNKAKTWKTMTTYKSKPKNTLTIFYIAVKLIF